MSAALAGDDAPCPDQLTIAEGIAVKTAGQLTREIVRTHVDEIVNVEEENIERAVALLLSVEKTVVEGAGAAGLATILERPELFAGQRVATILSGGNIDLSTLASVAMRELVRSERMLRFDIDVTDAPGALAKVATVLGNAGANIVAVEHDRLSIARSARATVIGTLVEVEDAAHAQRVVADLAAEGLSARVRAAEG